MSYGSLLSNWFRFLGDTKQQMITFSCHLDAFTKFSNVISSNHKLKQLTNSFQRLSSCSIYVENWHQTELQLKSENFFCKIQDIKYKGKCCVCHSYSVLQLQHKSGYWKYTLINHRNLTTLFTKTGNRIDKTCGP